ncbi:MAG TPA: hypothetical protein VK854_06170 [Woeseiaceae bacterium]|nr:hypothetical protein [Woeseiaceae bacterium]
MKDRFAELEARLARVEARLSKLEGESPPKTAVDKPLAESTVADRVVASAPTHIGHTLLIFGGAYLLRAITDFQFVPTAIGLSLGATYALFWLYMAYRKSAVESQRITAAILGALSIVLIMPLLVEATEHFKLLTGRQSAVALAVYCALAFGVALKRDMRTLAWLATAGTIATGLAVMIVSHAAYVVATLLILLGLATLWIAYSKDWIGLQWLGAAGANAVVLGLVGLSTTDQWAIEPETAAVFATFLLLTYLVSFVYRTHVNGQNVALFEPLQALAASAVAFTAAVMAAQAGQFGLGLMGVLSIVVGGSAYALAFSPETRRIRGRNFFYYSTLGLVFVLAGSGLMLPHDAAAILWSLIAIGMAVLSGRTGRVALSLQCTLLLFAAGVYSGILSTGLAALVGDAGTDWPGLSGTHAVVAMATVVCLFIPVAQRSERWGKLAGLPQLIVLALSVWEVGGLMVVVLAPSLAAAASEEPNLSVLASVRTAVLSVAAVTLAISSRHWRWPEARWLAYPLLILVAIKLFAEDFPHGQPATLFVSLAFVGSALLLVAKVIKRAEPAEAP